MQPRVYYASNLFGKKQLAPLFIADAVFFCVGIKDNVTPYDLSSVVKGVISMERGKDSCCVDEAYPPVKVEKENKAYAAEMLGNMGGCVSEMSAITLFVYNKIITAQHKEIACCFRQIAVADMQHLEIFGKLSMMLGTDPRLWCRRCSRMLYWSPAFNRYPQEIKPLILNSIEVKAASIDKYSAQAGFIEDAHIINCLKRIIIDEQHHLKIFESMLSS